MDSTLETPPPPKKSSALITAISESGNVEGLVIASCGSCNFGVKNRKGCSLTIKIGDTIINNNDYVLADIDGVVIIPQKNIEDILKRSEKLINTENLVRKSIKEGMDPQEAYLKYSAF